MCVYCHVLKKRSVGRKYFFIYLFITELMWETRMQNAFLHFESDI